MKREREQEKTLEGLDIAKCLMLLSKTLATKPVQTLSSMNNNNNNNLFECKTCNKKFSSFQALGGHRASHKRPKLSTDTPNDKPNVSNNSNNNNSSNKLVHECSICGQAFGMGQALGGHMRRHRGIMSEQVARFPLVPSVPVLKRSNSSRRVLCLDLNLTPLENDLEYVFGKNMAPKVDPKFIM